MQTQLLLNCQPVFAAQHKREKTFLLQHGLHSKRDICAGTSIELPTLSGVRNSTAHERRREGGVGAQSVAQQTPSHCTQLGPMAVLLWLNWYRIDDCT
jgi:hypothetical protein